jgi:hypothetical protein
MVLVDTSIWIRGIAGQEPVRGELDALLATDEVAAHDLVYGELLTGDRGDRREFFAMYERIDKAETVPHDEVVAFVRDRDLSGRGVGWVDVHLLASAIAGRMKLWTADRLFAEAAEQLGVGYKPGKFAK